MGQLILFQLDGNDFGYSTIEENIPPDEVEHTVVRHAERMYPEAEHLYYYDHNGEFTADIIINDYCSERMVYTK